MDTYVRQTPLQTVQLIPIFTYLNLLSDFLFTENYLTEGNQTKQIPIVNVLYEYLEDHRHNLSMTNKLIRNLLKESDLYGAKMNEQPDAIFVNEMFDYIISSLVFDKYGNIYGFLADVFRTAEYLQINYLLNVIKENLEFASFENEYGERSTLSPLAVNRIYNDILLPLFPQPIQNLSLSSLDYIYAQAGLMFLRLGRVNTNYYIDFEHVNYMNEDGPFDECLVTGYLIEKLFASDKEKYFHFLKPFALPALSNYIFNNKYLFVYENIGSVISDSSFWQEAYRHFFQYTQNAFNKTRDQLNYDYTLKMHVVLSRFRSRSVMAQIYVDYYCKNIEDQKQLVAEYLKNPENYECKTGTPLPNLKKWYFEQINEIVGMYKSYDLQLIQRAFGKSLIFYIEHIDVTIKLLRPFDNVTYNDFSTSRQVSHDVLEIYFSNNRTFNYYALVRENYNVMLINHAVNPELFQEKVGKKIEDFHFVVSFVLKTPSQSLEEFWENLIEYKANQLKLYLEFLDAHEEIDESWKSEWWKEFGLSMVPYYPCLIGTTLNTNRTIDICTFQNVKLFEKFQEDIFLRIVQTNTQSFLSSLGTTIRSVILDNVCEKTVAELFVALPTEYKLSMRNFAMESESFKDIAVHMEDPSFELRWTTPGDVNLLEEFVTILKRKTNLGLEFVRSKLDLMGKLISNIIRNDVYFDQRKSHFLYVNCVNSSRTGYGYKFFFVPDNLTKIAYLRTDYEFKNEILVVLYDSESMEKYVTLDATTFKPKPNSFMYQVNNQLRSKSTRVSFSGISVHHDDYQCTNNAYFQMSKYLKVCLRKWRLNEKLAIEERAIKIVQKGTNLLKEKIKMTLNEYTFLDNATLMEFVTNWIESEDLQPPVWGKNFVIDNPAGFNILKYNLRLENHDVSEFDGEFRIKSIYSQKERQRIEREIPIKSIIKDYNDQKACYSASFEDYYAIRNFVKSGYRRITGDTNEAKLIKLALYKLAIRQSDDPDEEFELKLFRVESKPIDTINKLFSKDLITLQKFTIVSTSEEAATRFAVYPSDKYINIIYEMEFQGPYLRAKVEETYICKEKTVILLPGSEFIITERKQMVIKGLGTVLKLKMEFKDITEKYLLYKKIMNQIAQIQF